MALEHTIHSVLIADDSRLVACCVATILRQMGVEDIHFAYKPLEIIQQCKLSQFDLIICDYNFQTELNGFQILEELQHSKTLPAKTIFIFLTGENDNKIVRTILDTIPDDYLLKPFNPAFFISRLKTAVKRKSTLNPIYEAMLNFDFKGAIQACDDLLPFHSEYSKLIRRFRANALVKSHQFSEARAEYEKLLAEDDFDWIKTALANTLIETENIDQAITVLKTVKCKKENPYYHDEMSNIAVINDDLPKAIAHLKHSSMLLDAGAARDLVICNLSLASDAYRDAVTYMQRYYEKNRNTFRGGAFTLLNYVRCHLYQASGEQNPTINLNALLRHLEPYILEINRAQKLEIQANLITTHIALLKGDLRSAVSGLKYVLSQNELAHFYDLFHLCILLEKCSLLNEVKTMLVKTRESITLSQHPSISRSQMHMLKNIENKIALFQSQIEQVRRNNISTISSKQKLITLLESYVELHDLAPNSKKICFTIVRLISNSTFEYSGELPLLKKLYECNHVILNLASNEEMASRNYYEEYQKARKNLARNATSRE